MAKSSRRSERAKSPPDDATLIRALKYARVPRVLRAEVCRRYGITIRQFRDAARRLSPQVRFFPEDVVAVGMLNGRWADLESLGAWIDYFDHGRPTDEELRALLEEMTERGRLAHRKGRWRLVQEWPWSPM